MTCTPCTIANEAAAHIAAGLAVEGQPADVHHDPEICRGGGCKCTQHRPAEKDIDMPDFTEALRTGVIINPGSRLGDAQAADGWTNTYATARAAAEEWLAKMNAEGIADIEMVAADEAEREGRWRFMFRHTVTGVEVDLETHGIDDVAAYERQHIFAPRVYWGGSSSGNPEMSDFAAPGYVMTFRPTEIPDNA